MKHLIFFFNFFILFSGFASVILLWIGHKSWDDRLIKNMRLYWSTFTLLFAKNFIDSYLLVTSIGKMINLIIILSIIGLLLKLLIIYLSFDILILPLLEKREKLFRSKIFLTLVITLLLVIISILYRDQELYRVLHIILDYFLTVTLLIESSICLIFYLRKKLRYRNIYFLCTASILIFSVLGVLSLFHDHGFLRLNIFFEEYMIFPIYYFSWSLYLIINFFSNNIDNSKNWQQRYSITNREKEIVELLREGKNRSDIAEKLFISPRTVDNHIANIYRKCAVKNRMELVNKLR